MASESMTSDERLWAAIRLEKPDRVPVVPTLLPEPAAGLSGRTQAAVAADNRVALDAVFDVFDEYGGWENPYPAAYAPAQLQASGYMPMKMRIPGVDLSEDEEFQIVEEEILEPSDYDKIQDRGVDAFFFEDYLWRISDLPRDELPHAIGKLVEAGNAFESRCAERGLRPTFATATLHPFFMLSLMRSMVPFTQDLYYDPEPVERAIERMTADLIPQQIARAKQSGIDLWLFVEERASGYFYSPAVFERFWWPYTREIVDACWSEGIVTIFHLDQCWDKNLSYFRELPRGSAVLSLDSTTDIFAAREILGDHLCLWGDVSAALFTLGQPADVSAYCEKLIDEVGDRGGFILGSGCSVPPTVRPENFRSMIETGKQYELSRR
jgi:uroporphyrinogen-III decarboxylase